MPTGPSKPLPSLHALRDKLIGYEMPFPNQDMGNQFRAVMEHLGYKPPWSFISALKELYGDTAGVNPTYKSNPFLKRIPKKDEST